MISVEFFGAAKTVTGSNYLVKTNHGNFVVDCGMFQGPDVEHLNLEDLEYNAQELKFAMLTHAHMDHSGMLPKLIKNGFSGKIYATSNTIQLTTELLLDSAKIQENNFQRGEFYGKYTQIKAIVYNTQTALATISMFSAVAFDRSFEPVPGIKITYIVAGHILGAASILVEVEDEGVIKKIVFSGDIGRVQSPIIPTFNSQFSYNADYVIMESLYGGQVHVDRIVSAQKLVEIIDETTKHGGNAFIPCFAVQRAQEILSDIKDAKEKRELDNDLPVFLDSPLAQRITGIYSRALSNQRDSEFDFDNLIYVKKAKQSAKITNQSGQVILAGSGMADGGRIMDHLIKALPNKKHSVIFVGFQAEGTLGRKLVEGEKKVLIGTKSIDVKAKIYQLEGFSAHGDTNDYTLWLNSFLNQNLKKIFLVHAEIDRSTAFQEHLVGLGIDNSYIPNFKEKIIL